MILKMGKDVLTLTWFEGEVPKGMQVRQVYGVVFTQDGRTLLKIDEHKGKKYYSLVGGTPEVFDDGHEATLRREMLEEANVTLKDKLCLLGYQQVEGDQGRPAYAQMRMVGLIENIGKKKPDPDNGRTYERLLTTPEKAIKLLGWGDIGEKIIRKAVIVAQKELAITEFLDKDEYV